jgi:DNA-binding MarR family transcriptional regulator
MTPRLDPVIHQATRLEMLALLHRNRQASFTELRDRLGLTPGNLASHAAKLEDAGYIRTGRLLVDLTFEVHYRITDEGIAAFRAYLAALQQLLQEAEAPNPGAAPAPVRPDVPGPAGTAPP